MSAIGSFLRSVRADYRSVQVNRAKYHRDRITLGQLPLDLIRKIGFQMMVAVRVMGLARDLRLPLAPQILSRLIRHLYGAEIHWDARLADGISVVHGVGLVIGHGARVGERCILFHNVTLGESLDPETKEAGSPELEEDVHVGPGATILGPIIVGAGTKIMGGSVLDRSVPPRSLVRPAPVSVSLRASAREVLPEGASAEASNASTTGPGGVGLA